MIPSIATVQRTFHVRSGRLATHLVRPVHPMSNYAGHGLAWTTHMALITVPTIIALFVAFDATLATSFLAAVAMFVLIPLGYLARLLSDGLLALTSMWLTKVDGIRGIYFPS